MAVDKQKSPKGDPKLVERKSNHICALIRNYSLTTRSIKSFESYQVA